MAKQPSLENSTWARHPSRTNLRRPLPFSPTPSSSRTQSRPGSSAAASPSVPFSTTLRETPRQEPEAGLPSHTKATFQWMRGELLGQGSYGRVFMALNANTGELMAVKQVEVQGDHKPANQDALKFLAFENKTLRELDHPNVVQYLGYEESPETLSLFLEYVPGGTIATLLNKYGRFHEEVTKFFMKQILDGLEYLHSRGILHRDLKPDNILVEPTGICKISDFGISKRVGDMYNAKNHTLMKGTVHYMAPEILGSNENRYDGKIDIWSVGCMIMEMWSGEKPWGPEEGVITIMLKLREVQTPPPLPAQLAKELPPDAHNFRESCFYINPIQRPSAAELKQHPYLRLPLSWNFDSNNIPHPSREKRVGLSGRRQRDNYNDGATYRPKKNGTSQDLTLRPLDVYQSDNPTLKTARPPVPKIPRGPSPPIVVIEPLDPISQRFPSPSPVESPEQDRTTSGSSTSSRQKSPGKRKYRYRVANPGDDKDVPPNYQFVPRPLPSASPYSAHLAASSKHNLNYIPDSMPEANPTSRSRSSSTPHPAPIPPDPSSSSYPSYSHSSSKSSSSSNSSLLQSSSGTEDDSTWKRPPASAPLHRSRESSSNSRASSSNSRHERGSSSSSGGHYRQAAQLRTPPPPSVPPPLPPLPAPSPSSMIPRAQPSPASALLSLPSSSASLSYSSTVPGMMERLPTPQLALGRPNADDVVRHLGTYFPDHDLDQPAVVPSPSTGDLTERPTPSTDRYNYSDRAFAEHNETVPGPSTSHQHRVTGLIAGRFSFPRPSIPNPFSSSHRTGYATRGEQLVVSNNPGANDRHTNHQRGGVVVAPTSVLNRNGGRLEKTKSIRRLAEERQFNPDKTRRRTLWDIKMEEVKQGPWALVHQPTDSP